MWKELLAKTDAVLFDLDGTVVDSMWIWKQIDIDYFARFGIVMPDDYQRQIEGLSFYETAVYTQKNFMPSVTVEDMINDWNDMAYSLYANTVKPKEYIETFLKALKRSGKKLGIATSNSRILCNATLKSNGLYDYFDSILTGEECGAGKPCPDIYINSARQTGARCERCMVFEDICKGIEAGNAAGMITVAIHDDYSTDQWEEKCKIADLHIMSYKEIVDEIC
ncbi:MAG: HAD family phosphatase [Lachnospiraceae bacterium]|nr:HAD family phosphatase [Lachnospiraceae bacterium]